MYYRHFGLSGPPFRFTCAPETLFTGKSHREALAALEWGLLYEPTGFTLLIGEPGMGKTTLAGSLLARSYQQVRLAFVGNPRLGLKGVLREIVRQFGIPETGAGRIWALEALNGFLAKLGPEDRAVVIFDEAQLFSDTELEEIRLLANCGPPERKQLNFLLLGQPVLLDRLADPRLRQLNDRIGARAILKPLGRKESHGYIAHRLYTVNGDPDRIFDRRALAHIVDSAGGIPRRMSVLCHNAMLLAYAERMARVTIKHARSAVKEYEVRPPSTLIQLNADQSIPGSRSRVFAPLAKSAAVLAMLWVFAMGAVYFWSSQGHATSWVASRVNLWVQELDQLFATNPQSLNRDQISPVSFDSAPRQPSAPGAKRSSSTAIE
ncbi:MAG: AAA family ATPase [Candidatus Binataceae bacterium]|nr:AAA family ATPase [Candidatus Binataceae bacterium]